MLFNTKQKTFSLKEVQQLISVACVCGNMDYVNYSIQFPLLLELCMVLAPTGKLSNDSDIKANQIFDAFKEAIEELYKTRQLFFSVTNKGINDYILLVIKRNKLCKSR
jgi:hypothetical protein